MIHVGPAVEELAAQNMAMQGPVHDCTAEEGGEYHKKTYTDEVYAVKSTAFADVSPGETFQLWVYNLHNERHPFADVSPGETFSSLGVICVSSNTPSPMSHRVRHF